MVNYKPAGSVIEYRNRPYHSTCLLRSDVYLGDHVLAYKASGLPKAPHNLLIVTLRHYPSGALWHRFQFCQQNSISFFIFYARTGHWRSTGSLAVFFTSLELGGENS